MRIVLAHGASGNAASMLPWVRGLEIPGIAASAIDLPVRRAEDAVEAYRQAAQPDASVVIGGQSYGGRVASLLAARPDVEVAGLVLLCYPLHRPGQPDGGLRSAHWPAVRCPVLLLSGESDPFARIDLLRAAVAERLPRAQLITYPRLGHGLTQVQADVLERIAGFVRELGSGAP